MKNYFLNTEHRLKLKSMIKDDKTHIGDTERLSLFYIISGNEDLYRKRKFIYNTKEHSIYPRFEEADVDFSTGIKSLIKLGYNLYNGWSDDSTTPIKLLSNLDEENLNLAERAMKIRFNYNILKELKNEILK